MAEVDGNRTRRTGIARANRFEGGGAHQALGHLRPGTYRAATAGYGARPMRKLVLFAALIFLARLAAKKAQHV